MVALVTGLGLGLQRTVFGLLGATDEIMPLVIEYMNVWFLGSILLIVPLIGNGALRASGDSKTPMFMMIAAAIVNAVLDPLFIFGGFGFEPMGIKGAAYATLAALFVGMYYIWSYCSGQTDRLGSTKTSGDESLLGVFSGEFTIITM